MLHDAHFPGLDWLADVDLNATIPANEPRDGLGRHIFVHVVGCACRPDVSYTILIEASLHDQVSMHDVITGLARMGYSPKCRFHRRFVGLQPLPATGPYHYEAAFKLGGDAGLNRLDILVLAGLGGLAVMCVYLAVIMAGA